MKCLKRVVADIPLEFRFARQVIRGVYRYAQSHCQWVLGIGLPRRPGSVLRDKSVVGIISMRQPGDYVPVAQNYGLKAVGTGMWTDVREFTALPYVDVDPNAIGEMAADYFIERGFRSFGMFTTADCFHGQSRGEAFVAALRRRKLPCDIFDPKKKYPSRGKPLSTVTDYNECIRRWLVGLAKPLAVFTLNDPIGAWICAICYRSDIRVPEEVAVLGADNDEIFCNICGPPLSSIRMPVEQVGYEAARLLDAMLRGRRVPKRPILLPPIDVVTRQSTDIMAVDDRRFVEAVRFIREHACEGIRVKHVTAASTLPKRMMERQFKEILGRGPFAEIRRVQVERIKMLLSQTDKTLEAIAPDCGFGNISHMSVAFKKATGMAPGAYRRQFRSR